MSKNIVTSDGEAQGALAFSYKFGRTVDHPPTDPNVKQRPKRGANGFVRPFVEELGEGLGSGLLGEGLGSGLMGAVGMAFFQPDDDNDEQPDDDNEQPDDDNDEQPDDDNEQPDDDNEDGDS